MRYKRYEKYKDSGVEWIGEIPEHWELTKIKFISTMYSGNGFKEGLQGKLEGDYPFFKVSDINGEGKFVTTASNYVDKCDVENNRWNIIPANSILFPKIGEALKKNHRKINTDKCLIDNNTAALRPNERLIDVNYFYYLFCCINAEWFVNPGAVPSIDNSKLKNFIVVLPLFTEQTTIANFLDQKTAEIDSLIADKERLIQLLQEKRQAIITEAVTKGLDPNVPMKDSGVEWIGEIPEHWEVSKLKHILKELVSGGTPSSADEENWTEDEDGINWVSIGDMSNMDYVYKTAKKITLKGLKEKNLKILKSGTLIYSIYATLGKVAELKIDAATNQAILGLILKEGQVNKQFIKRYLESLEPYILYLSSSNTQNNLNAEKVKNIDLVLPKNNEQTAIANFLDQKTAEIDSLIADLQNQIAKLKEYRQSLIYEAVTGKIDVRDFTTNTEGVVLDAQNTN